MNASIKEIRLLFFGMVMFLLGLLVGLLVPMLANPRMGLSAHLEGLMNGIFLMVLGLIWSKLVLSANLKKILYWAALYGTFSNLIAVVLAATFNAGMMMPLAKGQKGTLLIDVTINFLLVSLSIAMLLVSVLSIIGLWRFLRGMLK